MYLYTDITDKPTLEAESNLKKLLTNVSNLLTNRFSVSNLSVQY